MNSFDGSFWICKAVAVAVGLALAIALCWVCCGIMRCWTVVVVVVVVVDVVIGLGNNVVKDFTSWKDIISNTHAVAEAVEKKPISIIVFDGWFVQFVEM
jgi:hypothetical protein